MDILSKEIRHILLFLICLSLFIALQTINVAAADEEEGITVFFTVSEDGDFVVGNDPDNTVLASTPLEVEYFDLAEYGLERYNYDKSVDNEQPTLLHAYIRATEKYYLGRKMTPDDFDYKERALWVTNSPGSLFIKAFWGHDENLLYHFNHEYPEESPGWGATCDTILLEDGDAVDLAMFTDWGISSTGAFAYFPEERLTVDTGEIVEITGCSTAGMMAGTDVHKHVMENEQLRISKDKGRTWIKGVAKTDDNGIALLRFLEPGTYYVSAGPVYSMYENQMQVNYRCVAPPICIIEVTGDPVNNEPHTVIFDSCGGSSVATQSVGWYTAAERPEDPVKSGFDFTGWYTDQKCGNAYDFDVAVKSDLTLYAGWEETPEHAEERAKKEHEAAVRKAAIKKAKAAKTTVNVKALTKHRARVTWKKVTLSYTVDGKKYTRAVTGYKIYRATKKNGKYKLVKTIKKAGTLKYTDKKLKKGKKYYYKVRTYTKIGSTIYLGKWSRARKIRVR